MALGTSATGAAASKSIADLRRVRSTHLFCGPPAQVYRHPGDLVGRIGLLQIDDEADTLVEGNGVATARKAEMIGSTSTRDVDDVCHDARADPLAMQVSAHEDVSRVSCRLAALRSASCPSGRSALFACQHPDLNWRP